jgi:hypothetical protein
MNNGAAARAAAPVRASGGPDVQTSIAMVGEDTDYPETVQVQLFTLSHWPPCTAASA